MKKEIYFFNVSDREKNDKSGRKKEEINERNIFIYLYMLVGALLVIK